MKHACFFAQTKIQKVCIHVNINLSGKRFGFTSIQISIWNVYNLKNNLLQHEDGDRLPEAAVEQFVFKKTEH